MTSVSTSAKKEVIISFNRIKGTRFGLILVLGGFVAAPASAYKWPGDNASLGSAIAAKVIGQQCVGVLSASDIGELDAYLAKAASELARKPAAKKSRVNGTPFHGSLMGRLTETSTTKYRDTQAFE